MNMDKKQMQDDLNARAGELLAFAREKKIFIGAVQKVGENGYIETVPLYRDLKVYPQDAESVGDTNTVEKNG